MLIFYSNTHHNVKFFWIWFWKHIQTLQSFIFLHADSTADVRIKPVTSPQTAGLPDPQLYLFKKNNLNMYVMTYQYMCI